MPLAFEHRPGFARVIVMLKEQQLNILIQVSILGICFCLQGGASMGAEATRFSTL